MARNRPSSPGEILQRRALRDQQQRIAASNPEAWGVNEQQLRLPANRITTRTVRGARDAVVRANRLDAFEALHRARGLSDEQLVAANRLVKDWADWLGIDTSATPQNTPVDEVDDHEGVTQRIIDARIRIDDVFKRIGRADAALLGPLVELVVLARADATTWWRGAVQKVTGEAETHAQGAVVRRAVENLRLAYAEVDRESGVFGSIDFHRMGAPAGPMRARTQLWGPEGFDSWKNGATCAAPPHTTREVQNGTDP